MWLPSCFFAKSINCKCEWIYSDQWNNAISYFGCLKFRLVVRPRKHQQRKLNSHICSLLFCILTVGLIMKLNFILIRSRLYITIQCVCWGTICWWFCLKNFDVLHTHTVFAWEEKLQGYTKIFTHAAQGLVPGHWQKIVLCSEPGTPNTI